jgi:hypothetical protein
MSELVERVATQVGLDKAVAEKAIGIMLDFLAKEGPQDKVQALLAKLPGADALLAAGRGEGDGGLFGSMGGIMGAGSRLMGVGLDMGQIQGVIREIMAYSREKGAADALGDIAASIPGMSQFV